jgi:toxin-antitoxin system PIN domain toxin
MPDFALLDLNVLIALAWPQHIHHWRAQNWFAELDGPWATTPITEVGFVRLSTNPAVVGETVPMTQALAMLDAIRSTAGHAFIADDSTLAAPKISVTRLVTSKQVTDVHLVNLAASSGGALATLDKGILGMLADVDRKYVELLP